MRASESELSRSRRGTAKKDLEGFRVSIISTCFDEAQGQSENHLRHSLPWLALGRLISFDLSSTVLT